MPTRYIVTMRDAVPNQPPIVNRPCTVKFTYPDGGHSDPYSATVVAHPHGTRVEIQSNYLNIEAAWVGANGGTLEVNMPDGELNFSPISNFAKAPSSGEVVEGTPNALMTGVGAAATVNPIFGVVFVLNGTPVPISGTVADIQTKGFKFKLPDPVGLGTPADFLAWVDSTFGTDLKTVLNPSNLPTPIADVVNSLLNVYITIEQADVNVPPKGSADSTTFTLIISAEFPGAGIQLIPGSNILLLKGGVAGATNIAPS